MPSVCPFLISHRHHGTHRFLFRSIHCHLANKIWDIKEGENADNLGPNGLVVSARKCAGPIPAKNCCAENLPRPYHYMLCARMDFLHEVQFSAAIEAAYFPAAFGMLLSQHPKEGAPFLGTALAAYKQSIEPEVSCHFHLLDNLFI